MPIHYKLSNTKVCNNEICLETTFLLNKGLSRMVILGIPFLNTFYPFKVTEEGIISTLKSHKIYFKFSKVPNSIEINNLKSQVNEKEKFLYSPKRRDSS